MRFVYDLSGADVVLMRQDPPFDMAYITATHILERIHPRTLVVRTIRGSAQRAGKLFVTEFAEFIPPTLITSDLREIRAFRDEHKDIILSRSTAMAARACSGSNPTTRISAP